MKGKSKSKYNSTQQTFICIIYPREVFRSTVYIVVTGHYITLLLVQSILLCNMLYYVQERFVESIKTFHKCLQYFVYRTTSFRPEIFRNVKVFPPQLLKSRNSMCLQINIKLYIKTFTNYNNKNIIVMSYNIHSYFFLLILDLQRYVYANFYSLWQFLPATKQKHKDCIPLQVEIAFLIFILNSQIFI